MAKEPTNQGKPRTPADVNEFKELGVGEYADPGDWYEAGTFRGRDQVEGEASEPFSKTDEPVALQLQSEVMPDGVKRGYQW